MRTTLFLGLFLLAANTPAAVNPATTPVGSPPANSAPPAAVPDEIAYKAFLTVLTSTAEQNHHSYLHLLGEAFRVSVDSADQAGLQFIDSYGVALLDQQAALEAEENGIRRHLLCSQGMRPQSASEFFHSLDKIDRAVEAARKTRLQASLSEMPDRLRAYFTRFLTSFSQGVSHTKLDIREQLGAMDAIEAYIASSCAPGNDFSPRRQSTGGAR